jgi:deoxyribodipyrimidine photo-lyase
MTSKFENGLFIFRRDLRIVDNNGLNLLNSMCKNIFTIFIFTPEQVGTGNKYKSNNAVQFMIESIDNLDSHISKMNGKLYTFYGHNETIIEECIRIFNIDVVCFNLDISPYAKERDASIIKLCEKMKTYVLYDYDYYLHNPNEIKTGGGTPYQKFTPYYETALKLKVEHPLSARKINFDKLNINIPHRISTTEAFEKFTKENENVLVKGGRDEAIKNMRHALTTQKNYSKTHDTLMLDTSLMGSYIKFGCVSIREVYFAFRGNKAFIRQLYWRDFYAQILFNFPHVLGSAMKPNYNKIRWHHNEKWFKCWCTGATGFPVVDAAMRQLNTTGFCHNRARLIVASFLVKTLLISWEKGEKYFSTNLTDYDPASNNLNWQWCASTAIDSQPYFRIFNPWNQQKEHDPDCEYIKKWVPELREIPVEIIHKWNNEWQNYKNVDYPRPICNYEDQKLKALKMYKSVS